MWWNQDSRDVRQDTANNAINAISESDRWRGQWETVMKLSHPSDLKSEAVDTRARVVGGKGSAGIGLMHLDFEGIESARLRNPMLISPRRPGTVLFRAPLFATTDHWWEIALPGQRPVPDVVEQGGFVDAFQPEMWVRRGIVIPDGVLHPGANSVRLSLSPSIDIDLDRLQIELDTRGLPASGRLERGLSQSWQLRGGSRRTPWQQTRLPARGDSSPVAPAEQTRPVRSPLAQAAEGVSGAAVPSTTAPAARPSTARRETPWLYPQRNGRRPTPCDQVYYLLARLASAGARRALSSSTSAAAASARGPRAGAP